MGAKKGGTGLRQWCQLAWAALSNGYLPGWKNGRIYTGGLKRFCLPGLNCYSCPGALGACPIGSLQATLGSRYYHFAFYVLGFLLVFGALLGRFVCGWLCPFGLLQDLLYRLPLFRRWRRRHRTLPGERWLRRLRYLVLGVLCLLLPLVAVDVIGQGRPWFCAYLCPAGTLEAGIPLVLQNPGLRQALGWLFGWKTLVLGLLLAASLLLWRPFCRYLCPLGAVYGAFNGVALLRHAVNADLCTQCGACQAACALDIPAWQAPNSPDCVRCGACLRACPTGALQVRRALQLRHARRDEGDDKGASPPTPPAL